MNGRQTKDQVRVFLILLYKLPPADQLRWFEMWIRAEIESSEMRSQKVIENIKEDLGLNKGNENQGELSL